MPQHPARRKRPSSRDDVAALIPELAPHDIYVLQSYVDRRMYCERTQVASVLLDTMRLELARSAAGDLPTCRVYRYSVDPDRTGDITEAVMAALRLLSAPPEVPAMKAEHMLLAGAGLGPEVEQADSSMKEWTAQTKKWSTNARRHLVRELDIR